MKRTITERRILHGNLDFTHCGRSWGNSLGRRSSGIQEQTLTSPLKVPVQESKVEFLGTFSFQRGL